MAITVQFQNLTAAHFLGDLQSEASVAPVEAHLRRGTVLQIVKAHPDGITAPQVVELLKRFNVSATKPTVVKDLEGLEREREVYSNQPGARAVITYYPNGRLIHPLLKASREIRGKTYQATVQQNRSGPAIQLQERTYSLLTGDRVEGAIFIDYAGLDELLLLLQEIKQRYESHQEVSQA